MEIKSNLPESTSSQTHANNSVLWGIDLGGTKIEIAVIDSSKIDPNRKVGDQSAVILRERIDTEQAQGYEHILSQINKLIKQAEKKLNFHATKIGMGTPGSLDPKTGIMRNSNTVCLNGKRIAHDLEKITGKKLILANDANCLALAEVHFGAVRKFPNATSTFGVIMGTGIGGGLVINQQIIAGHMGIAGEWGHNYLDASGGECYCGKIGCVERIISGPALQRYYFSLTKKELPFHTIYQAYKNGDKAAVKTLNRLFEFFGKSIAVVINIFDPDVIVLGGGVGNIPELYTLGRAACKPYIFNTSFTTEIVPPENGDSAGVFGAAFL